MIKGMFLLISVAILGIEGCPKAPLQAVNLTEKDNGKAVTISKGQEITLTLPNKTDGGYRFDKPECDTTLLHLEKYTERPPDARSALGAAGQGIWQFIALKTGETTLKITVSRPWTKESVITEFETAVTVK
jgi:predicted secreted protein